MQPVTLVVEILLSDSTIRTVSFVVSHQFILITLFGCYKINLSHLNVVDCNHEIFISVYDKQLMILLFITLIELYWS